MENYCNICKLNYADHSTLRRHAKKFHPDKLDDIAPNKILKKVAVCGACGKSFSANSSLRTHLKKFHSQNFERLCPKKYYTYECKECHKHFSHLKNLRFHCKIHQGSDNKTDNKIDGYYKNCPMCEFQDISKVKLIDHLREIHSAKIERENLEFSTLEEFELWKSQTERITKSRFVKYHSYKAKNYSVSKYVCHRTGTYVGRGKGLRRLKIQGSNKIGSFCPASMELITKDEKFEVTFTKSHVGHNTNDLTELGHLFLSDAERQTIAAKIAAKIPFSAILDEIRDSVTSCELERVHLLTKKDLYNIKTSFKLNAESVLHENDTISIEAWINDLKTYDSLLFYKPQGTVCEQYTTLKKEDFALIIMSRKQTQMLQQYGEHYICIDGTNSVNAYGFELHTLLVLDDLRDGFPCAFLISNLSDEEMISIFFAHIRKQIGSQLQPKVYMSDMAESYYNAWIKVMRPAEFRLFSTWHVDQAWRKNLSKIGSKERQSIVYRELRTLLQESDISAFSTMLEHFMTSLKMDKETIQFAKYFEKFYYNKAGAWAYSIRVLNGLNRNMHLERMQSTIKYLYLKGEHEKRIDKAINSIFKFVRDKHFNRTIVITKGNLCTKIKELKKYHTTSIELNLDLVLPIEMGWQVGSAKEMYFVEERRAECKCKLVCSECQACIHQYSCTCLDSCIKYSMCKHIHLICRYRSVADEEGSRQSLLPPEAGI